MIAIGYFTLDCLKQTRVMASTLSFDGPFVASESFRQILTNTNHCLDMFEHIETNRTWSEWASDWAVGERNSINGERMVGFLKKLINNARSGQNACAECLEALDKADSLNTRAKQMNIYLEVEDYDISQVKLGKTYDLNRSPKYKETKALEYADLITYGGLTVLATGTVTGIEFKRRGKNWQEITKLFRKVNILTFSRDTVIICSFTALGVLLATIAYNNVHSKGLERGEIYHKVKELYETLALFEVEGTLASFDSFVMEIESVTRQIHSRNVDYEKMVDFHITEASNARFQIETNLRNEEKTRQNKKGVTEAMKLYQQTIEKELNDLSIEEPDMSEEMRKRSAKRIAKNSCKSFLKGKLNYTDDEADEFVEVFQN
ncbi:hypothetical protein LOD99_5995 [Oopsacas minuta]|uniref:Uncharacterized protein n=1 Tax=Oopsacas minuta TaxID=111878 RepID=A0AAV7JNL5_9METZ|nr:hypothetical protein LOD99_5995 [Oopsacas minuta]